MTSCDNPISEIKKIAYHGLKLQKELLYILSW